MHNIDETEINKFNQMAQDWWNPEGQCKPLHQLNPVRMAFIQQEIALSHQKVLDIGCGGGILCESLALAGALVTGIDISESALNIAKHHQTLTGVHIDYQLNTAEAFAHAHPEQFDVLTCMEMLEHVPDPISVIQSCAKLVKPGGTLFFSTLNRHPKAYGVAILAAEYLFNILPRGTHDYAKFIRPSELSAWLRSANLSVEKISGISYHLLNQRFTLSKDVRVNYLLSARKPL